jgi:hypothetical protein
MVSWLIQKHTDTRCEVASLQSYGRSESTQSSYVEVKCKDGGGFVLRTPLPGSAAETTAMNCAQAAQQGIKCRLTDAGAVHVPTTLESLKSALVQNETACNVEQTRLIGQEDHRKRYVLEYLCAGRPAPQVAFIPLGTMPIPTSPWIAMPLRKAAFNASSGRRASGWYAARQKRVVLIQSRHPARRRRHHWAGR